MKTVTKSWSDSFREKGSKFIGFLFPAETVEAFEEELDRLKSKYPDATHHCFAWRIGPDAPEEFSTDDGEPSGTAGAPILNRLRSHDMINVGVVVVRYYGGTNLGKRGLIDAYGDCAERCLQAADLFPVEVFSRVTVSYPYAQQNGIEQLIHRYNLRELGSTYMAQVTLQLGCPPPQEEALKRELEQMEHLGIEAEFSGRDYQVAD